VKEDQHESEVAKRSKLNEKAEMGAFLDHVASSIYRL